MSQSNPVFFFIGELPIEMLREPAAGIPDMRESKMSTDQQFVRFLGNFVPALRDDRLGRDMSMVLFGVTGLWLILNAANLIINSVRGHLNPFSQSLTKKRNRLRAALGIMVPDGGFAGQVGAGEETPHVPISCLTSAVLVGSGDGLLCSVLDVASLASICWQKLMIKRADSARADLCRVDVDRTAEFSSILFQKFACNRFSCCSLVPSDCCETVLVRSRVFCFSSLHIARGYTIFPPSPSAAPHRGSVSLHGIHSAQDRRQPITFHRTCHAAVYTAIQRVSHRGRSAFVLWFAHSVRLLFCSPLSWRSLASAVAPSGASVLCQTEVSRIRPFRAAHPFNYCPFAFGWRGVASRHFRHLPRPSPRWLAPTSALVPHRDTPATAPPVVRSPVHLPRTSVQFLKPTPALRPVFLVPTRA